MVNRGCPVPPQGRGWGAAPARCSPCRLRVTDQPSAGPGRSVKIGKPSKETGMSTPLAEEFHDRLRFEQLQTALRPVCILCGRVGVKKIDQEREKS